MEATQDKIGKLLEASQQRDAIHIAVAPAIASVKLDPGQHVGIRGDKAIPNEGFIGIVDPFLKATVNEGQRFFIFLYPNTVMGLRHVWRHPDFDGAVAESEKWLREFAESNCAGYDERFTPDQCYAALLKMSEEGDFCFTGQPDELYNTGDQAMFWHHLEVVRGAPFPSKHKADAEFRCSC